MKAMDTKPCVSMQNILFATDFSPIAENAASYALALAKTYHAQIFALHVRPIEIYGMAPPESWPILRAAADGGAQPRTAGGPRSGTGDPNVPGTNLGLESQSGRRSSRTAQDSSGLSSATGVGD